MGYAQFDFDPVSETFLPEQAGIPICGQPRDVAVKAGDFVFHWYAKR
jgi:hypothetical protein